MTDGWQMHNGALWHLYNGAWCVNNGVRAIELRPWVWRDGWWCAKLWCLCPSTLEPSDEGTGETPEEALERLARSVDRGYWNGPTDGTRATAAWIRSLPPPPEGV